MRQKNTVYHQELHNQFQNTPEEIKESKWEKAEHTMRDEKQGQSKFRVDKVVKK